MYGFNNIEYISEEVLPSTGALSQLKMTRFCIIIFFYLC